VSLDYSDKAPFKFNGTIEQVHVEYVTGSRNWPLPPLTISGWAAKRYPTQRKERVSNEGAHDWQTFLALALVTTLGAGAAQKATYRLGKATEVTSRVEG
jgi:hypothetical protein